jgi:GTP-sensing pleiotropic transcriptional regulator CodY
MCGMRHATQDTATTSDNPTVARIRGIPDPVARAAAAQTFIVNGRRTLRAVERVRDDAIREARQPGRVTIDQLANQVGARRNVVVTALRNRERGHP